MKYENGKYWESDSATYLWTVYTKDKTCKRGEYAEEIDVITDKISVAAAKRVTSQAIEQDYMPGLYPSRVSYWGDVNSLMFLGTSNLSNGGSHEW